MDGLSKSRRKKRVRLRKFSKPRKRDWKDERKERKNHATREVKKDEGKENLKKDCKEKTSTRRWTLNDGAGDVQGILLHGVSASQRLRVE
jgi:hypothetical protein